MAVDESVLNGAGRGVLTDGSPPRENLARVLTERIELRRSQQDAMPTMLGHFAVFNQWAEINSLFEGHFMERFAPGAFSKTFQENRGRIKCIHEHGLDPYIGKKVLGPVSLLEEDELGAAYEVPMLDTSYNHDLIPGIEAGLYGSSFVFGIVNQKLDRRPRRSAHNPDGLSERTVTEAFVKEFGTCTFPIYKEATAGMRSVTDDWMRATLLGEEPRGNATASIPAALSRAEEREEEQRTDRLYRRSVERVSSSAWAIELGALATIKAILAERASGVRLSEEEIQERIGTRAEPDMVPDGPVSVIRLRGPIVPHAGMIDATSAPLASVDELRAEFRDALASEDVKAILFDIDSPGGTVDLIPELAAEIIGARGQKPIVAIANTMAASAGYWILAAADEAVVTPSGMVGSIGVYSAHDDISGMQEKLGVNTTLVSAGKYKVEGNPFEPLTDEAKNEMQAIVDEFYGMFVAGVAKGRGVSPSVVREDFGQGRIVLPSKALEAGMVDRIATFDETLARLTKAAMAARSEDDPEPEPPAATTPHQDEPEPSEVTTRKPRFRNQEEWLKWISRN